MQAPAIGVVVPVYNRATTVLPTLDSIAAQTVPPRQLVVVDDGSHDGSAESVERWLDARKPAFEVRVVRKPNGGAASARNQGLAELGHCPWVAFLDSDDRWPGDFLARASAAFRHEPTAVAASADRWYVNSTTGDSSTFELSALAASPALWMLRHGAALLSCSVLNCQMVWELGGFPEHLPTGEDASLLLPLSQRGKWLHLPGNPVRFERVACSHPQEAAPLSRKFPDNQRQWARGYDRFFGQLSHHQIQSLGSPKVIRRLLSDRWLRAGHELAEHGMLHDAANCYAHSLRWRWTKWDHWRLLARTEWAAWTTRRRAA